MNEGTLPPEESFENFESQQKQEDTSQVQNETKSENEYEIIKEEYLTLDFHKIKSQFLKEVGNCKSRKKQRVKEDELFNREIELKVRSVIVDNER
jgi:hypothetical protein